MADWKEMYLTMFRATEKAMRILEAAQLKCEEMYMRDGDGDDETPPEPSELQPFPLSPFPFGDGGTSEFQDSQ